MQKPRLLIGSYAAIAVLMLAELLLSNLGTLIGNLEATAAMLGLTPEQEQVRLIILMLCNMGASDGALLALASLFFPSLARYRRIAAWLTTGSIVAYALYQIGAAQFQLGEQWRLPITIVGVVYLLLAAYSWWIGQRLIAYQAEA